MALFCLFCAAVIYFTCRAIRWRIVNGNRRSILTGLFAAFVGCTVVLLLTYCFAWVNPTTRQSVGVGSRIQYNMPGRCRAIFSELEKYAKKHGGYPNSLRDVFDPANLDVIDDPWGVPLQYFKTKNGFFLRSLGRDKRAGGTGLDADFEVHDGNYPGVSITFLQFVFTAKESYSLFLIALSASILAGLACFIAVGTPPKRKSATGSAH